MQGVSKISVTLREILGQIFFFFYGPNPSGAASVRVAPCLSVSLQSGEGRKMRLGFGVSKPQPFGENGSDSPVFSPHPSNCTPQGFGNARPRAKGSGRTGEVGNSPGTAAC